MSRVLDHVAQLAAVVRLAVVKGDGVEDLEAMRFKWSVELGSTT